MREDQTVALTVQLLRSIRNDQIRAACRKAVEHGWHIKYNGSGHIVLYPRNKNLSPVVVSKTAVGEHRTWQNFRSELRKRGLRV